MDSKNLLATTKTGLPVYIGEETCAHMRAHGDVRLEDVAEAISLFNYQPPFQMGEVHISRIVGNDRCVERRPGDEVRMMRRANRQGRTPVVFGREPVPTDRVCVGVCTDDDGKETLFTAFYGRLAPKEPWDPHLREEEREASEAFWSSHAIVADGTETD